MVLVDCSVKFIIYIVDLVVLFVLLFFLDEFFRRKRFKLEDMDSVEFKRRRYMDEEYEVEF